MTDVALLLKQLRELPSDQLSHVESRLKAWRALGGEILPTLKPSGHTPQLVITDYILLGIEQELRRIGLLGPSAKIQIAILPDKFQQKSEAVRSHLEGCMRKLKSVERAALGRLAGRALADYLQKIKVPVTIKTMLLNVDKIVAAIDESFPGYIAAGLLPICWEQRKHG